MSNPTRHGARPAGARHLRLNVEFLDDGGIRLSSPDARGFARVVRGPMQLWTRLRDDIRREVSIAGYSRWRGVLYDLDELTDPTDPTEPKRRRPFTPRETQGDSSEVSYAQTAVVRPDQHHPADWTPNPDGSWNSPSGRRYRSTKYITPLLIDRARMGLATTYDQWVAGCGDDEPTDAAS